MILKKKQKKQVSEYKTELILNKTKQSTFCVKIEAASSKKRNKTNLSPTSQVLRQEKTDLFKY